MISDDVFLSRVGTCSFWPAGHGRVLSSGPAWVLQPVSAIPAASAADALQPASYCHTAGKASLCSALISLRLPPSRLPVGRCFWLVVLIMCKFYFRCFLLCTRLLVDTMSAELASLSQVAHQGCGFIFQACKISQMNSPLNAVCCIFNHSKCFYLSFR